MCNGIVYLNVYREFSNIIIEGENAKIQNECLGFGKCYNDNDIYDYTKIAKKEHPESIIKIEKINGFNLCNVVNVSIYDLIGRKITHNRHTAYEDAKIIDIHHKDKTYFLIESENGKKYYINSQQIKFIYN